jgi:hypothetical protein
MNNDELIAKFQDACESHHGSRMGHAYANGFLGSIVSRLLDGAPEAEREMARRCIEQAINKMSVEAA